MEKFLIALISFLVLLLCDPFLRLRNIVAADNMLYIGVSKKAGFSSVLSKMPDKHVSVMKRVSGFFYTGRLDVLDITPTEKHDSFSDESFLASVSEGIAEKAGDEDKTFISKSIEEVSGEILETADTVDYDEDKPATEEPETSSEFFYSVDRGDTLIKIAKKFAVEVDQLKEWNSLSGDNIRHGQILKIQLNAVYYECREGDNLSNIADDYDMTVSEIIELNSLKKTTIHPGQILLLKKSGSQFFSANNVAIAKTNISTEKILWPVKGRITSAFGYRMHPISKKRLFHNGIDIGATRGTPILSIEDGTVIFAERKYYSGKLVMIKHRSGLTTVYAHCDKILVKKGQEVKKGEQIATVGRTGRATGYHLHFGVKKGADFVNPMLYLE